MAFVLKRNFAGKAALPPTIRPVSNAMKRKATMHKQNTSAEKPAAPVILRVKQVAERLSISPSAVWYKTNPKSRHHDPAFPKPFKVSASVTGWLESEVNDYIGRLAAARNREGSA